MDHRDDRSDQAETLRRLMRAREERAEREQETAPRTVHAPARHVITFASGKGGTGKTVLAANLATLLARAGQRVLLVDGDFGLANLDLVLNVQPQATVEEVLSGQASVHEALVGVEPNLWLLPARGGFVVQRAGSAVAAGTERARLAAMFEEFPWEMDAILLDVGPGIQENVLSLHSPDYASVVILTPEPTAMADAYGLIKLLRRERGVRQVSVIVNQVTDAREGLLTYQKLRDVAARFVDIQLEYLGHCPKDEKFAQSVVKRKILLDCFNEAAGARNATLAALELLSKRIRESLDTAEQARSRSSRTMREAQEAPTAPFWRGLLTGEGVVRA